MSSKFKKGSSKTDLESDWLDDEVSAGPKTSVRPKPKKPELKSPRTLELEATEANATVVEIFHKQCQVRRDSDGKRELCPYRWAAVVGVDRGTTRERSPVAVGDRVKVLQGIVEGVCRRENYLLRPAPGKEGREVVHVLAANLDVVVIVASLGEPAFSTGLVDRYLIATAAAGIPVVICLNKFDLYDGGHKPWQLYIDLGYEVIEVSAKRHDHVDDLREKLKGKRVVFSGQSGVGKTSLLRELLARDFGKVAVISEATKKGQHTTTSAVQLDGPEGSFWIDTPGVREFGIAGVKPEELATYFPEFAEAECTLRGCLHAGQENCCVTEFPRYANYFRIYQSLSAGEG